MRKLFVSFLSLTVLSILTCCTPEKPIAKKSSITISTESEPHTFDPRHVRTLYDRTYMHLLYEGLMRTEKNEKIVLGIAENYLLSPDQKTYTFNIRKTQWSDGQPVTAYDFYDTWKTLLHPDFPAPNAYQFYVIKNAEKAKKGEVSFAEVGIKAIDDHTLEIELEQPTPYFLNLIASHFFLPVCRAFRENNAQISTVLVSNGAFQLEKNLPFSNEWKLTPNPYYWDRSSVKLDEITILKLDNPTATKLFEQNELAWMGSPLSTIPIDNLDTLKKQAHLKTKPANGVYFLRINTTYVPLNQPKFRQALACALNRTEMVKHVLQGNQIPAQKFVPNSLLPYEPFYKDNDPLIAKKLFNEALQENKLSSVELPEITICYANNANAHKVAQVVQQQWQEILSLKVNLQSCEAKVYYDHLNNHRYQISIGSWFADINDPFSFLDVFKLKNNGTNHTQWEDNEYIHLLDQSAHASADERTSLMNQAEIILMKEMPIIPLYFASYNYLQSQELKGIFFSDLGYLDFKHAYLDNFFQTHAK